MALLKKKGIIGLLFIFIMSAIGCGNNTPKDIDGAIYKKSVEMLAYTERCFNNDTEADGEKYEDYVKFLNDIYKKQNRNKTKKEAKIAEKITASAWESYRYKVGNFQTALDDYQKYVKEAKEYLSIPIDRDSNEVWDKIKEK